MNDLRGDLKVEEVATLERVAMGAWPGLEVARLGGWYLRHALGVTRRANSVWPNQWHGEWAGPQSLDAPLAQVEQFYRARGLPARFQVCPAAQPAQLDQVLESHGYRALSRTAVQTTALATLLAHLAGADSFQVEVAPTADATWWTCYAEGEGVEAASVAGRMAICDAIAQPKAFATLSVQGRAIAVGSAAVEAGWIGFFNIATLPAFRRRGAGRAILAALAAWGEAQWVARAYLQVMASNEAALALYARLGFTTGYYYHYREK